jgi:hypothetical protein
VEDNHHPIQLNHHHIKSLFDIHDRHAEQIQQVQEKYFFLKKFQIVFLHHHLIIHVINHINLDIVLLIDQMELKNNHKLHEDLEY